MALLDQFRTIGTSVSARFEEKKGIHTMTAVIAERKAFLSKKRLEYIAKFRIDDQAREVRFTEMLKESGSGLSAGTGPDDMSAGFGFKAGTYKMGGGRNEGTIQEQSALFGKTYQYTFDVGAIRKHLEAAAVAAGYRFTYQITPIGL
jgi:hypothetical protein